MRRIALVLAGLALVSAACGTPVAGSASPAADPPAIAPAPAPPPGVADPASLDIPKIGARSSLKPSGTTPDGGWEVAPLTEPLQATWFQPGPEPGEPGTSVILGHVNGSHRPGIFARLHELAAGDEIRVTDVAGLVRTFRVDAVRQQPKEAWDPAAVLGPTSDRRLALVTCGGALERTANGGNYTDNVLVSAVEVV